MLGLCTIVGLEASACSRYARALHGRLLCVCCVCVVCVCVGCVCGVCEYLAGVVGGVSVCRNRRGDIDTKKESQTYEKNKERVRK